MACGEKSSFNFDKKALLRPGSPILRLPSEDGPIDDLNGTLHKILKIFCF
jgi:hypothetical protein